MTFALREVFYASVAFLLYTWVAYPLLVSIMRPRLSGLRTVEAIPTVTVLVTVWNGRSQIAERLRNILSQGYPANRLRVFVASDGSTDGTVETARLIEDARVTVKQYPQCGKSATQNAALREISSDVVVFTDAETRFAPDFLKEVVRPFCDPAIGCVSGCMAFLEGGQAVSTGQSLYWRFETWLRSQESRVGLLTTASGACMACRRALLRPLMAECGEDCTVPLDALDQGYKVAHASEARAYDCAPSSVGGELRARTRMTCRNLRGITAYGRLLNPFRHPGYALALWSHKIFRWATPIFTLASFLSSVAVYAKLKPLVWAEALFIALSAVGLAFCRSGSIPPRIISLPFSILLANVGFLLGVVQFLRGQTFVSYRNVPSFDTRLNVAPRARVRNHGRRIQSAG